MHWNLEVEEYQDCCGVVIICGFPQEHELFEEVDYFEDEDDDGNWHKLSGTQKQELKDVIKGRINDKIKFWFNKGMFQVILNDWQNRRFGKVVKSCGFKMKQAFVNPNTRNKCFFYYLVTRQPQKVSKRKRVFH